MSLAFLKSRNFHSWLGFAVSIALIAWVAFTVEWAQLGNELLRLNWVLVLPVTGFLVAHYLIRALRWRYLLPQGEGIKVRVLFDCIMVGNFATFVLPLRAGEFIRAFLLSRQDRFTSFSTAFVSVVVERFFDLMMVLGAFAVVIVVVPGIPDWAHNGAFGLSILALCIFLVMVVGTFVPHRVMALVGFVTFPLPLGFAARIKKFAVDFLEGAGVLRHGGRLLKVLGLSVIVWVTAFGASHIFFWLFSEDPPLMVAVTVGVIVALAVAAPSAPGFIGVYQVACLASFKLFGLSSEFAIAYSIVSHLIQYALFVLYGIFVLTRLNLNLRSLQSAQASS